MAFEDNRYFFGAPYHQIVVLFGAKGTENADLVIDAEDFISISWMCLRSLFYVRSSRLSWAVDLTASNGESNHYVYTPEFVTNKRNDL